MGFFVFYAERILKCLALKTSKFFTEFSLEVRF